MNYTEQVREEYIENIDIGGKAGIAFACALTKCAGSVAVYKNAIALEYEFKSDRIALKAMQLLQQIFNCRIDLEYNTAISEVYTLKVDSHDTNDMLRAMNVSHFDGDNLVLESAESITRLLTNRQNVSSFMQGVFLTVGSVYIPDDIDSRGGYHLEFNILQEDLARTIVDVTAQCGLHFSFADRGSSYGVYTKNSETICDFFAFIKAGECAMRLNDILIKREVNNNINRQANVFAANADKITLANSKYMLAVERLTSKVNLQAVDPVLYKVAMARMEDCTESMGALAQRIGMSKSSVARALKKIITMEEEYNGR
ncbi:MAG: DNA-binding protein WhiA [Christensenellales bacterium]